MQVRCKPFLKNFNDRVKSHIVFHLYWVIQLPNEAFELEETVDPIRHIEDIDTGPLKHDTCLTLKPDFVDNGPVTICSFPTYIFP